MSFVYVYVDNCTGHWTWVPGVDASPAYVAFMAAVLGGEVVDLLK